MAELIGGAVLGDAVSRLSTLIIDVINTTKHFKSKLNEIHEILTFITPIFDDITRLDEQLDRRRDETVKFKELLEGGENLITKCEHIRRNLWKRYRQALKLDRFKRSLVEFNQIYGPLLVIRDVREGFAKLNRSSRGCSGVPLLHDTVIGFDVRVGELKALVLKDSAGDGCSVVVVSAAGGCGKTTLVTMLCNDPQITRKYGDNIYFVIISSSPNIKVAVKSLLESNKSDNQLDFASEEAAIQQWGNFMSRKTSPVLLVLDDVWSHSVIKKFQFKSPGYKILVTSRTAFTQYNDNAYKLPLLDNPQAYDLFRHFAFSEQRINIPDELVKKLVKCCKNHPLALVVVGGMLNGRPLASWEILSNELSTGNKTVWDYEEFIKLCLDKSLDHFKDDSGIKDCYLDLGLFPEDQKIAGTALVDIWAHLYNHDEQGKATRDMLSNLSSKNLATLLQKKEHFIDNHCEDESIMQHDMMRRVAIRLSSLGPVKHRKRLIINPDGKEFPIFRKTMNARLLSISTDERFKLRWKGIKLPKVEVFVLNYMSKMHPLPNYMKNMKRLKVLIITNYGYNFSELQNFPEPKHLSSLTTIRLDHVSISSISTSILELENLRKLSLIMCKIGNTFSESTIKIKSINKLLPKLSEMVIDSCDDLLAFPAPLCNLASLRKLVITNCHELSSLAEDLGNLTSLEVLQLASCSKLATLPESLRNLRQLSILDVSHCLHLRKLPLHIGELVRLQKLDVSGCTELEEPPESVKDLLGLEVLCDKEKNGLWNDHPNVKVQVVEEDPLDTFRKIVQ